VDRVTGEVVIRDATPDDVEGSRSAGFTKFFTYIRADNPDSIVFYSSVGFRVGGTAARQARVGGEFVDEVVVEKLL
jgi:RimJ/RimL family protein N-acetyltransferase